MSTELTAADYESAAFGDRIRNILDLVDKFKDFDLAKFTDLLDLVKKIGEVDDLKAGVKLALEASEIIASMTPTETDDNLVAIVKSIMTDDVLDIITKIVGGLIGTQARAKFQIASADMTITAADKATLEAKNIPISFLFQVALQLLPLLERFFNKD